MIDFAKCFELLTGNPPFTWQIRLYEKFLTDEIPSACDIPTGLGKTSVIAIWLLALAAKLLENPSANKIPRRLVYVVDRRVIVDQATKEAEDILCKILELKDSESEISRIYNVFRDNSFLDKDDKKIIALSTLRGEFADNREWCLDPSRPAIIVGTIDMIGSRLLFSAYGGVGESYKALQAGLLGQDSLIVVDEAHLSPAFVELLKSLPAFVQRKNIVKSFSVMFLSATLDEKTGDVDKILSLEKDAPEDLTGKVAAPRLNAEKRVEWEWFLADDKILKSKKSVELLRAEQAKEMAKVAAQYKDSSASVLIFGATVSLVKEIRDELVKTHAIDENQVLVMVGGMRGYERDDLVNREVFKQFDPKRVRVEKDESYFLIATSRAEVGVNLDADYAVCDLTSADSFIQRLGRVNRFGYGASVITIVHERNLNHASEQSKATFKTLKKQENGESLNASPLALRGIEFPVECYPPKPVSPPLDSARIDDWAMTSLKQNDFRRPLVSYWLRGVTENKTPETSLCWRADLNLANTDRRKIATVKTVRVKSRECARESTGRAEKTILAIANKEQFRDERAVIISAGNEYEVCSFAELAELKEKNELFGKLMFATVVLPCEVGGLDKNGIAVDELPEKVEPVSDAVNADEWQRILFTETEAGVKSEIIGGETKFEENVEVAKLIRQFAGKDKRCVKQIKMNLSAESEEDGDTPKSRILAYFISRKSPEAYLPNEAENDDETEGETASVGYAKDDAKQINGEVSVEKHNSDVGKFARRLAEKLYLNAEFIEALEIAGRLHDRGKDRKCWQTAVGNFDSEKPLAKSSQNWFNYKLNDYYRHEFGSLIEAEENAELENHPNRDLILHLIATHHGYARPHFPERAFDPDRAKGFSREVAERAMLRFAKLQIEYGWWQLAYLEAILKSADALASRAEARGEI